MFNVLNPSKTSKLGIETNDYLRDVFANYVRKYKSITPVLENRIKIKNPQKNDSKIS